MEAKIMLNKKTFEHFTLSNSKELTLESDTPILLEALEQEKKFNSFALLVKSPNKEISEFLDSLGDEYGLSSRNFFLYDNRYLSAPQAFSVCTGKGREPIKSFLRPFLLNVETEKVVTEVLDFKKTHVGGAFFNKDIYDIVIREINDFEEYMKLMNS
jgi:hypothetical protein